MRSASVMSVHADVIVSVPLVWRKKNMRDVIGETINRNSSGAPCKCGGYGDEMEDGPTKEEIKKYDCGRSYACCTSVFKCRICKKEFIARLDSPDF